MADKIEEIIYWWTPFTDAYIVHRPRCSYKLQQLLSANIWRHKDIYCNEWRRGPDSYVRNSTYQVIYFLIYSISHLVCTASPFNSVCRNNYKSTTNYMKMAGCGLCLIILLKFFCSWELGMGNWKNCFTLRLMSIFTLDTLMAYFDGF